jgi:putative ATP-dependent endonuclease of OLD family
MHISRLSLVNYRNFASTSATFNPGVNTVIGENGSGKTNLFRALRLLLDQNMLPSAYRLDENDFHRGLPSWKGHWIIISAEFAEISSDESVQALFIHGTGNLDAEPAARATYNLFFRPRKEIRMKLASLARGDHAAMNSILATLTIEDYETTFTGRSTADFTDELFYKSVVGDFENAIFSSEIEFEELGSLLPKQLAVSKEISFSYIQALRDVVQDFQNNRANPLRTLLKSKSGEVDEAAFATITDQVLALNVSIESWPEVANMSADIKRTIKDAVGAAYSPTSLTIKSDLPDDADRLFQSLRLFVGEGDEAYAGGVHELSLGGANLIYLTLKLLEFKYQKAKQSVANFILIEEPEAHIHNHIQKTLFDRLNYEDTQIIYSTHSTQISEVCNVENMNILGRSAGRCEVYQPAAGLITKEIIGVQRYLDAVRSNLLFARSVILVEGDAEEILIPAMIKKVFGIGLDELGISIVNIRSTGFENIALLFSDQRIRKRCAIVTDLDTSISSVITADDDSAGVASFRVRANASQTNGARRKARLEALSSSNQWIEVFFAPHTFEVDFLVEGNVETTVSIISEVYSSTSGQSIAKAALESADIFESGYQMLKMATRIGKGWFAILLAGHLNDRTVIPAYILQALKFSHPVFSSEVRFNILTYRLDLMEKLADYPVETRVSFRASLEAFRSGTSTFADLKALASTLFEGDQINDILEFF